MALVLKRLLTPAKERAEPPDTGEADSRLSVEVIFTSARPTVAALRTAGTLAARLNARIHLVVPQVVPHPLPLSSPPVLVDFSERRFRAIAEESGVETSVNLYLCRDAWETLLAVLKPRSLVVLGGPKRWWPTAEKRLARTLRRAGHEVVLTEMN